MMRANVLQRPCVMPTWSRYCCIPQSTEHKWIHSLYKNKPQGLTPASGCLLLQMNGIASHFYISPFHVFKMIWAHFQCCERARNSILHCSHIVHHQPMSASFSKASKMVWFIFNISLLCVCVYLCSWVWMHYMEVLGTCRSPGSMVASLLQESCFLLLCARITGGRAAMPILFLCWARGSGLYPCTAYTLPSHLPSHDRF